VICVCFCEFLRGGSWQRARLMLRSLRSQHQHTFHNRLTTILWHVSQQINNNSTANTLLSYYEATTHILHSYSHYKTQKYIYRDIYKRFLYILTTIYVPICIIWYNVLNNTLHSIYAINSYFLGGNKPWFLLTFPDNSVLNRGLIGETWHKWVQKSFGWNILHSSESFCVILVY